MKRCYKDIRRKGKRTKHTVGVKLAHMNLIMATIFFATIGRIAFIVIAVALLCFPNRNTIHVLTAKMIHKRRSACGDKQMCS